MAIRAHNIALGCFSGYLGAAEQKSLGDGKALAGRISVIKIHTLWGEAVAAVLAGFVLECIEVGSRLCAPIHFVLSRRLFALITSTAVSICIQTAVPCSRVQCTAVPFRFLYREYLCSMPFVVSSVFSHGSAIIALVVVIVNG